jgi:parallel beta-helix repeat protein
MWRTSFLLGLYRLDMDDGLDLKSVSQTLNKPGTTMKHHRFFRQAIELSFIGALLIASPSYGLTIYFCSSLGDDLNTGKSACSPWKTLSRVSSAALVPGDAIYFRAGDTFHGQINVNQSDITFGSYGGPVKPIISGGEVLTGWTLYSGSIYQAQASALVKNLFSNGVQMTLARYPNTGFMKITSAIGANTLTVRGLNQASGYWNGAALRLRTTAFSYEIRHVESFDGTTLVLQPHASGDSTGFSFGITAGYGCYLDNTLAALDTAGEWYCDPSTNMVYFFAPGGIDPASLTVTGSTVDYGVNSTGSDITIEGLEFRYQALSGIHFSGMTSGNRILSNAIISTNVQGVQIDGTSTGCTIDGNTLQNINGRGIYLQNSTSSVISNNSIKCVGLVPGYGIDGENGESGIVLIGGSNDIIRANVVDSVGYTGIRPDGHDQLVENNIVKNVMLRLSDGGAIHSYNENGLTYGSVWRNNILMNAVGNVESSNSVFPEAHGLYWDFGCHDMTAEGNTVIDAGDDGIYLQYACYHNTIRNNTFYACGGSGAYFNIDPSYAYGGNRVAGNIFYTTANKQAGLYVIDPTLVYHSLGTLDSNMYCNPVDSTAAVSRVFGSPDYVKVDYTLDEWKRFSQDDALSRTMYKRPASYEHDTIIVNQTGSASTFALASFLYHDLLGNPVSISVTVPAFSSLILIRDTALVTSPPPVQLVSFTLSNTNGIVELSWKTAAEANIYGFEIEKQPITAPGGPSQQTTGWNTIGFVAGNGTSNVGHAYSFADPSPTSGNSAYRLKQIGKNGLFTYSSEIDLNATAVRPGALPQEFALRQNYPNPFNPSTTISYDIASRAHVLLKLYDLGGREVATLVDQDMDAGTYVAQWTMKDCASGVYFYRLSAGGFTGVKKLLLQK